MRVGFLHIGEDECAAVSDDLRAASYALRKYGYPVTQTLCVTQSDDIAASFAYLLSACDAVAVCGAVGYWRDAVGTQYDLPSYRQAFLIGDKPCALTEVADDAFLSGVLLPILNSRCTTYYTANVFRTVGKTEAELRDLLKPYVRNRNKITFAFVPEPYACTVLVRYSNKTNKKTVADLLAGVSEALADCTYAFEDVSLAEVTARELLRQNKTVGLAESFTGGNIAASLVAQAGISASLKEGIVCYDTAVKESRLRVPRAVLDTYGAVSVETAYEMAANLLSDGGYDYVVATTGNAGPTAEKEGEVGVCYIAVGTARNVDIYPYRFEGDRATVIQSGTQAALWHLYASLRRAGHTQENKKNEENAD